MLREMKAYPQIVFNFAPPHLHLAEIKSPQNASVDHVFWRFWLCCRFQRLLGKYLPKCDGFDLSHLCLTSSGARDLKPALAPAGAGFFEYFACQFRFIFWWFKKPLIVPFFGRFHCENDGRKGFRPAPSVCTLAGGVFVSPAHVVKFYCRS